MKNTQRILWVRCYFLPRSSNTSFQKATFMGWARNRIVDRKRRGKIERYASGGTPSCSSVLEEIMKMKTYLYGAFSFFTEEQQDELSKSTFIWWARNRIAERKRRGEIERYASGGTPSLGVLLFLAVNLQNICVLQYLFIVTQ